MKYFKETEKAVLVKMAIDYYLVERTAEKMVWIPKSQMHDGKLTGWIADAKLAEYARGEAIADFFDAEGNELEVERKSSKRGEKAVKALQDEIARTFGKLRFA